ncbi:MAG: TetR/AcrR family transcriptional regulator [Rhodobacteraceae bacterium]|nr:TetR/AcrR family transcriptional regulator [Paracoccaceae bacterium]MBR9820606.1 TetR/AcrR family transcriptional regulator [Paracoccaceae bacterium]
MDLPAPKLPVADDDLGTQRYRQKRDEIVQAAARQIAERGLKGLTLVGVAGMVGLSTNSVTYYFRRKENLAEATLEAALARFEEVLAPESPPCSPREYLRAVLARNFALSAAIRRGEEAPLSALSDMRAMEEPVRTRLIHAYYGLISRVARRLCAAGNGQIDKGRAVARAQFICDLLHWARTWLRLYSIEDFPRVEARLFDLLDRGLAQEGAVWAPQLLPGETPGTEATGGTSVETYLHVATRLVNLRGYRGASVERIAGELQLSKGSFYHHLSGKDDLVRACFDHSFNRVSAMQHAAAALPGTQWERLSAVLASLMDLQVANERPLLRDTALLALPEELRNHAISRSDRIARRFAGMLSDGIADGSIRPVDPLIASQCLMGLVNSSVDMAFRSPRWPSRAALVEDYAGTVLFGLFN